MIRFRQDMELNRGEQNDGVTQCYRTFAAKEYPPHLDSVDVITLKAGESIPRHTHTGDAEEYYFVGGTCEYDDNGAVRTVSAGDATMTYDGEYHGLTAVTDVTFVAITVTTK